jgi:hypothetical protein
MWRMPHLDIDVSSGRISTPRKERPEILSARDGSRRGTMWD